MKKAVIKKIIMIFIVLLVIIILFSNIGQNFKNDIFSYDITVGHSERINDTLLKAKNYDDYVSSAAEYISALLKENNFKPLDGDRYIYEWSSNISSCKYPSSLEIVTMYGRVIKKYQYDKDFFEDYRGIIKPGLIINKAVYYENNDLDKSPNSQIVLLDSLDKKTDEEIRNIDTSLISKGVRCVLSPASSGDLQSSSGIYNSDFYMNGSDSGLIKLLISNKAFDEIKTYVRKGYSLKIKSGGEIKKSTQKNVYGILQGNNRSYKPLVVLTYFNGDYKKLDTTASNDIKNNISSSIMLECIRSLKMQRLRKPDRTIIFAFISGYQHNNEGLNQFFNMNYNGDYVFLDGFGADEKLMLSYSKPPRYFIETLEYFAKRNDISIVTKNSYSEIKANSVYITTPDVNTMKNYNYQAISKSGRFLLSFIGEQCYNLDFLSGNIPEIRAFKQIIRENTLVIALLTLLGLFVTIFKFQEP